MVSRALGFHFVMCQGGVVNISKPQQPHGSPLALEPGVQLCRRTALQSISCAAIGRATRAISWLELGLGVVWVGACCLWGKFVPARGLVWRMHGDLLAVAIAICSYAHVGCLDLRLGGWNTCPGVTHATAHSRFKMPSVIASAASALVFVGSSVLSFFCGGGLSYTSGHHRHYRASVRSVALHGRAAGVLFSHSVRTLVCSGYLGRCMYWSLSV